MNNIINKKKNIFSIFFTEFIRIRNVIAWTSISFVGFILGISSANLTSFIIPFFVFLISFFFIASLTFSMNNYYDAESDKINPRRININAVASGKISKHNAIFLNIIFVFITLVVTILFKFEVFLFSIFLLFLGLSYSVPPFRLKGLPVLDVIWHFFGFFSIAIYGSYVAGSVGLINWLVAISLGVWSSVAQVGNHIADYSSDKNSGTRTFAVWIGLDKAKITISVLTFLHLIFLIPLVLLYSLSYWITILIVILIPLLGFLILRPIKGAFPTKRCYTFYFTVVIGGAVYISCIFYKIMLIMGIPSFDFLHLYGFP